MPKEIAIIVDSLSQSQIRLAHQLDSLNLRLIKGQQEVEKFKQNLSDSQNGSVLVIIGLALEILGATALAGSYLGRKFVDITNFSYSVSAFDLGLTDPDRDSILWMIGLVGIFLLVLGFAGQFIGSLFAVTHTWFTSIILLGFAIVWIIFLVVSLTRLDPDQSLTDKIRVLVRNTRRFVIHLFQKLLDVGGAPRLCS